MSTGDTKELTEVYPSSLAYTLNADRFTLKTPPQFELVYDVFERMLHTASYDYTPFTLSDHVHHRGTLLLVNKMVNRVVTVHPPFWTRVMISPAVLLDRVLRAVARSAQLPLQISFRAEPVPSVTPLNRHSNPCTFDEYIADALEFLAADLGRCERLDLIVASLPVLDVVLRRLATAPASSLSSLSVSCVMNTYYDFRPMIFDDYTFATPPLFGVVFPPITSLEWRTADEPALRFTYTTTQGSCACAVLQPRNKVVKWGAAVTYMLGSPVLENMVLDDIRMRIHPMSATPIHILPAVKRMELTPRGNQNFVYMLSAFIAPFMRHLKINLTHPDDGILLCDCAELLVVASDVVITGGSGIEDDADMFQMFSHLVGVHLLDLRDASAEVFDTFLSASSIPPPPNSANWHACPELAHVILSDSVPLSKVKSLLEVRAMGRYPQVEKCSLNEIILRNGPTLGTPVEVLLLILKSFCGFYYPNMSDFIDARTVVMLENGIFWSEYVLVPNKLISDVTRWTAHFRNYPLDLRLYLDALMAAPDEQRYSIIRTAMLAGRYAAQCSRLIITSADGHSDVLRLLMQRLQTIDGTRLEAFAVVCTPTRYAPSNTSYSELIYPIFRGYTPALRFVRLVGFVLSWTQLSYYRSAVNIVFHRIMALHLVPTWLQLTCVLQSASNLTRLSLRHFSCGPPSVHVPDICLPKLVELDMCMCGKNVPLFLFTSDLPLLVRLTIMFSSNTDVSVLASHPRFLSGLEYFCPAGNCNSAIDIASLYHMMPRVSHLNISDSNLNFLLALRSSTPSSSGGEVIALPALDRLSVADFPLRVVADVLQHRIASAQSLQILDVHSLGPGESDADADAEQLINNMVDQYPIEGRARFENGGSLRVALHFDALEPSFDLSRQSVGKVNLNIAAFSASCSNLICLSFCLKHIGGHVDLKIRLTRRSLLHSKSVHDCSAVPMSYHRSVERVHFPYWLPSELWSDIFDNVLREHSCSFFAYNYVRDDVCQSYVEWEEVVDGDTRFWCRLAIDCVTSPAYVVRHLEHVKDQPLNVNICFDVANALDADSCSPEYSMPIHPRDYHYRADIAKRCIVAALPSIHLWKEVSLWASTDIFMIPILDVLGSIPAPNLTDLLFASPSIHNHNRTEGLFISPRSVFDGVLPNMNYLHMLSAAVPWGAPSYFDHLQTLQLGPLARIAWPTLSSLMAAFSAATRLRHLILEGGGVRSVPIGTSVISTLTMPRLRKITVLGWPDCPSMLRVFVAASLPALEELEVHNIDRASWIGLLTTPILRKIVGLTIVDCSPEYSHIPRIITSLVNVTRLDIAGACTPYFPVLLDFPQLCPALRHLVLGGVGIEHIYAYVIVRQNHIHKPLAVLELHHAMGSVNDLTRLLASEIRTRLDLRTHPAIF
ncbi:hypothetical protein C8R43DRAFT_957224 [Mycena crocata]|nr:hypothetical protein C8R43DRAFT_957224 [Mycena crocata]